MELIFICTKSITFNSFLKSQADYFIRKGVKVMVSCSDIDNLNFEDKFKYKINFPKNLFNLINIINYVKIYFQIKTLVKKNPSAIYYIHTPLASHLFRLFTYFYKIKIIYFVHGFRFTPQTSYIKNFLFKSIEKILASKTKIFITINNHDFEYSKLHLSKNKTLCYKVNGVGLNYNSMHFKKRIENKNKIKKILVIAAYKKDKGYYEILKLADLLKNSKVHIDCYGYGDYRRFYNIKNKKKINNLTFNEFDINLKNKIKNFDILVHLSKREGLPVSIMQSLAEGLPVICYNIRGNNDLIHDNFNGFFVKSYNEIPIKLSLLKSNLSEFNKIRNNAFKTITNEYLTSEINLKLFNIINKYYTKN